MKNSCYIHKSRVILPCVRLLMGACLVAASLLALTQPLPYADNPLFMKAGMGLLVLPLGLWQLYSNARLLILYPEALRIDIQGITDHSVARASGFTSWSELKEVYRLTLKDEEYLCAIPKQTDTWLATRSKSQQRYAKALIQSNLPPICIRMRELNGAPSVEKLIEVVKQIKPSIVGKHRHPKF